MKRIGISIDNDTFNKIGLKAKALGMRPTTYVASLVSRAVTSTEKDVKLEEQKQLIRAAFLSTIEIIGFSVRMNKEQIGALREKATKLLEESLLNEKT